MSDVQWKVGGRPLSDLADDDVLAMAVTVLARFIKALENCRVRSTAAYGTERSRDLLIARCQDYDARLGEAVSEIKHLTRQLASARGRVAHLKRRLDDVAPRRRPKAKQARRVR